MLALVEVGVRSKTLHFSISWLLEKHQHSQGTCEVGSPLPKEPIPLSRAEETNGYLGCLLDTKAHSASPPRVPQYHKFLLHISDSMLASWLISLPPLNSYHFPTGSSSFLLRTLLFWLCSLLVFSWSFLCLHLPPPPCRSFSPGQARSSAMFRPILSLSSLESFRCPGM